VPTGKRLIASRFHLFLAFLIWAAAFLAYSYTALTVPQRSSFLAPDENNTWCVARQIQEDGSFFIPSPLNERFGVKFFRGRLFVEARENRYTAFNSPGLALLVALGMLLGAPFFVVPFLSSLGAVGLYLAGKELGGPRAGILAALLFCPLPTVVYASNLVLDAVPSAALFLLGWGSLLRAVRSRSGGWAALGGFSLGLSFLVRQSTAVLILLLLLWLAWERRGAGGKVLGCSLVPAALLAAGVLGLNRYLYGGFLSSGQAEGFGRSSLGLLAPVADFSAFLHACSTYLLGYVPLLAALGLWGAAVSWRRGSRRRTLRRAVVFLGAVILATLATYGPRPGTWGFSSLTLSGSMARYFLPLYASLALLSSLALAEALKRGRYLLTLLCVASVLLTGTALSFGPAKANNLSWLRYRFELISSNKRALLSDSTPTVAFTKRQDKDLYNEVEVGLCFTEEDARNTPETADLFPLVDPEGDLMPVIRTLLEEGWRVMVANDVPELLDLLRERGFFLRRSAVYGSLFQVFEPHSGEEQ
jgi:hypothetical protein